MLSRPYLLEVQSGGNGADVTGVLAFLGFVGYVVLMSYMFMPMIGTIPFFHSASTPVPYHVTSTPQPPAYPDGYLGISIGGGSSVVVVTPSFVAPYPTYTPYPTFTAIPYEVVSYKFSFYDPAIGKDKPDIAEINWEQWNYSTQYCDSTLRNGERWEDNYFRAAACPYDLYIAGAYFEVVSPSWLKDLFPQGVTCKDTGSAVVYPFMDFLIPWRNMPMPYEETPWTMPVVLRRLR